MAGVEIVLGDRRARSLEPACRRVLLRLLKETGHAGSGLTLLLATDAVVRRLNRRFRRKDATTDVLSFPSSGELEPGEPHLGEIAISVPQAARQARRARWAIGSEMALLLTHGFLHLLGYDHEHDDGTMRRLESQLLRSAAGVAIARRRLPWGESQPPSRKARPRGARRPGHDR